jgi:hypothetical protein
MNEFEKRLLAELRAKKDALNEADTKMLADLEAKEKACQPTVASVEQGAIDLYNEAIRKAQAGERPTDEGLVNMTKTATEKHDEEIKALRQEIANLKRGNDGVPLEAANKAIPNAKVNTKAFERQLVRKSVNPDMELVKRINDELVIASTLMSLNGDENLDMKAQDPRYRQAVQSFKQHPYFQDMISALPDNVAGKILYSTGSTQGDEYVPTLLSSNLIEMVDLIAGLDTKFDLVDMPSQPWVVPSVTGHSDLSIIAEPTSDTDTKVISSDPTTGDITLTATVLGFRNTFTEELEQDSIIAMLPFLQRDGAKSVSIGLEDVLINGDTTSPHMDLDVTVATDRRKAWNGLRKLADLRSAYDVPLGTLNAENFRKIRKEMGKYGVNPKDLMYIVGIIGHNLLLSLKDSSGNAIVQTFDKFGASATWLTGFLSAIDGCPLLVSEKVRENLNATGKYDGTTTDNGIMLCAYRPGFIQGERKMLTVEAVRKPEYGKIWLIFKIRRDFQARYGTSDPIVAGGINLDVS